ncbi:MAG: hypothetical protein CMH55_11125 [Myxococcales bacterium]|nr:hypothetical protein [Myxococcales bacterium]
MHIIQCQFRLGLQPAIQTLHKGFDARRLLPKTKWVNGEFLHFGFWVGCEGHIDQLGMEQTEADTKPHQRT